MLAQHAHYRCLYRSGSLRRLQQQRRLQAVTLDCTAAALDQDVEVVLITLLDRAAEGGGLSGSVADPALQSIETLRAAVRSATWLRSLTLTACLPQSDTVLRHPRDSAHVDATAQLATCRGAQRSHAHHLMRICRSKYPQTERSAQNDLQKEAEYHANVKESCLQSGDDLVDDRVLLRRHDLRWALQHGIGPCGHGARRSGDGDDQEQHA